MLSAGEDGVLKNSFENTKGKRMPDEPDDLESLADELSPDEVVEAVKAGMSADPAPEPGGGHVQLDMTQVRQPDAGRNWGSRVRAGGNIGGNVVLLCTPGGDVIASGLRYEPNHEKAPVEPMRAKSIAYGRELIAAVVGEKLSNPKVSLWADILTGIGTAFRVTGGPFGDRIVYVVDGRTWNETLEGAVRAVLEAKEPGFVFEGEGVSKEGVEGFIMAARERYETN